MDFNWDVGQKAAAKQLFGRALRVALAEWILRLGDEHFYLQQAQSALLAIGEAPSGVSKEIRLFVDHGMLSEYRDDNKVFFTKIDSPLWAVFEGAANAIKTTTDERSSLAKRPIVS